jgi:cytochrome b subunit of formate dehydrogenase
MPSLPPPSPARRITLLASAVCVLALVAAGVSFAKGSFLGVVWILLAGLSSNMAWLYLRKAKADRAAAAGK